MFYNEIINALALRKHELGMRDSHVARKSGVSQPVVHRIFAGKHKTARLDQMIAIAAVLGVSLEAVMNEKAVEMRLREARKKAKKIVSMVQGTSSLESQGLEKNVLKDMEQQSIHEFLAGPQGHLWDDD